MSDRKKLWNLLEDCTRVLMPFYWEAMRKAIEGTGAPEYWYCLNHARGIHPKPFTAEYFHLLVPYASYGTLEQSLETVARVGYFERVGAAYVLTDDGLAAVEQIFDAAHEGLAAAEPLPPPQLAQLNRLLWRMVEAALQAPQPPEKRAITGSRWTDPGDQASGSATMDQYLTDLLRFRDDAHIAAWKPTGVTGNEWEALTFVWRGQARTPKSLADQLTYRGYSVKDYQDALAALAERGWVTETTEGFEVTELGASVRQEAEDATDQYCRSLFDVLTSEQSDMLRQLLGTAIENLRMAGFKMSWNLLNNLPQHLLALTRGVVVPAIEEYGLDQPGLFYVLRRAYALAPEPIELDTFTSTDPYSNPMRYRDMMERADTAGLVLDAGDDHYVISDAGRHAWEDVNRRFYLRLGELETLSQEELVRLVDLLGCLVEASVASTALADKAALAMTGAEHPAGDYAPLAKLDQHLDDLRAYRDDSHLAAWQPYGVSGPVWETLTFVWRGEANTAEELAAQLEGRRHSFEVYSMALGELVTRGWLRETADGFEVTDQGAQLRQAAEDATDSAFYAPWQCQSIEDSVNLWRLLTGLGDSLQQLSRDEQEPE